MFDAFFGAFQGGITSFVDDIIGNFIPDFGGWDLSEMVSGAAVGAIQQGLTGGNIAQGALGGGLSTVLGSGFEHIGLDPEWANVLAQGVGAGITTGSLEGGIGGLAGGLLKQRALTGDSKMDERGALIDPDEMENPYVMADEYGLEGNAVMVDPASGTKIGMDDLIKQRGAGGLFKNKMFWDAIKGGAGAYMKERASDKDWERQQEMLRQQQAYAIERDWEGAKIKQEDRINKMGAFHRGPGFNISRGGAF